MTTLSIITDIFKKKLKLLFQALLQSLKHYIQTMIFKNFWPLCLHFLKSLKKMSIFHTIIKTYNLGRMAVLYAYISFMKFNTIKVNWKFAFWGNSWSRTCVTCYMGHTKSTWEGLMTFYSLTVAGIIKLLDTSNEKWIEKWGICQWTAVCWIESKKIYCVQLEISQKMWLVLFS